MLTEGTLERLKDNKPFDSMSHGEFINHLLDVYEESDASARVVNA